MPVVLPTQTSYPETIITDKNLLLVQFGQLQNTTMVPVSHQKLTAISSSTADSYLMASLTTTEPETPFPMVILC